MLLHCCNVLQLDTCWSLRKILSQTRMKMVFFQQIVFALLPHHLLCHSGGFSLSSWLCVCLLCLLLLLSISKNNLQWKEQFNQWASFALSPTCTVYVGSRILQIESVLRGTFCAFKTFGILRTKRHKKSRARATLLHFSWGRYNAIVSRDTTRRFSTSTKKSPKMVVQLIKKTRVLTPLIPSH